MYPGDLEYLKALRHFQQRNLREAAWFFFCSTNKMHLLAKDVLNGQHQLPILFDSLSHEVTLNDDPTILFQHMLIFFGGIGIKRNLDQAYALALRGFQITKNENPFKGRFAMFLAKIEQQFHLAHHKPDETSPYSQRQISWIKVAIRFGKESEYNNLGVNFAEKKDFKNAEKHFIKSAEHNTAIAYENLGLLYFRQLNVHPVSEEQRTYIVGNCYYMAAKLGVKSSMYYLGHFIIDKWQSSSRSHCLIGLNWIIKACQGIAPNRHAINLLSDLARIKPELLNMFSTDVKNYVHLRACLQGHVPAMLELAAFYRTNSNGEVDLVRELMLSQMAAIKIDNFSHMEDLLKRIKPILKINPNAPLLNLVLYLIESRSITEHEFLSYCHKSLAVYPEETMQILAQEMFALHLRITPLPVKLKLLSILSYPDRLFGDSISKRFKEVIWQHQLYNDSIFGPVIKAGYNIELTDDDRPDHQLQAAI